MKCAATISKLEAGAFFQNRFSFLRSLKLMIHLRIQDGSDLLGNQRGLLFTDQKISKISIPSSFHSELAGLGTIWKCSPSSLLNWFDRVRVNDNNKMKPNLSLVHAQNGKQFSRKQKVSESLRNISCHPEARNVSSLNISSERK